VNKDQILRFAVGEAHGPRSSTWRLWVPKGKSDVYISTRRLGASVKVSLHESPGPSRAALTSEWVQKTGYSASEEQDPRLAIEWDRPLPQPPLQIARAFSILVPWDEVRDREAETGEVVWVTAPPEETCIHFDVVYVPSLPPNVVLTGHPGGPNMGTELVGEVSLENGERVFVTAIVRPMDDELREEVQKLRRVRLVDSDGKDVVKTGRLAFGTQPNPDADDGTSIGTCMDVTRQD
jgi:hypothetical protein